MKRPVLRWFGGKFKLAPWIIEHMPEHRIYVEPFGGAGSVLMRKPRSYSEVFNDLDDGVYHLFKTLQCDAKSNDLYGALVATPYSRREFELAHVNHADPIEKARRLVVRSFMGFGADSAANINSKTGFRSNSDRSGTTPAHDWVNYPNCISDFTERLRGVVIENKCAFEVMATHDTEKTLHYVDPPYPHSTRRGGRYTHEMSEADHVKLCEFLKTLKGKVIVSGYKHEAYNSLGWRSVEREARADGAKKTLEVLWMNYEATV